MQAAQPDQQEDRRPHEKNSGVSCVRSRSATLSRTAQRSKFRGIVVAKDAKRKALVTASPGAVRTVRAPGKYGAFRIGQRVVVTASRRSDGTFTARTMRPAGKSKQVRFSAVIVKAESSRLIVTAGLLRLRVCLGAISTSALRNDHQFEPRDKVDVTRSVKASHIGGLGQRRQTGHVETLVLEGIFLSTKDDGFDLAVVHRGLVHVSVPTGMVLPDFKAGDQIVVAVTVSAAGKFSFVKGQGEGKPKSEPPTGEAFAYGPLTEMSAFSVGVKRENGEILRCAIASGLDLSMFRLTEKVKLYCGTRDGQPRHVKVIASDHASVRGDGTGEFRAEGTLTEASADGATLTLGSSIRCSANYHLDHKPVVLGEQHALMGCGFRRPRVPALQAEDDRGCVTARARIATAR